MKTLLGALIISSLLVLSDSALAQSAPTERPGDAKSPGNAKSPEAKGEGGNQSGDPPAEPAAEEGDLSEFEKALQEEGLELEDLQKTAVTASRSEQKAIETDRSLSVVTRRDIREMQATSVPDALAESTGVFIQKTNRSAGTPILRGFVGPQNLFLIDGIRLNTSIYRTGPLQYLNITDPLAFDRLEVVRGPGSVLYGSDSFGGTVQMLTGDIDATKKVSLTASAGILTADKSFAGNAEASGYLGPLGVLAGAGYKNFGLLRSGDDRLVPASDNNIVSGRVKLFLQPVTPLRLTAVYLGTVVNDAGRIDKLANGDWRRNDNTDHLAYLKAQYVGTSFLRDVTATVSFHRLSEHVDRFKCKKDADGVVISQAACVRAETRSLGAEDVLTEYIKNDDAVNVFGGALTGNLAFLDGDINATLGLEFYREQVESGGERGQVADNFQIKARPGNYSDGSTFLRIGAFAHGRYIPFRFGNNWHVSANGGVRLAHAQSEAPDVPGFGATKQNFTSVIGTGGLMIANPDLLGVYVNVSQGFRAPNLQELTQLGSSGAFFNVPNPDLKPESILSLEAGVKLSVGPVSGTVSYFNAFLSDLIIWKESTYNGQKTVDGNQVLQRTNSGGGHYYGFEADLDLTYKGFKAFGSGTLVIGVVENAKGDDEPGRFVPPFFYNGGLRYNITGEHWYSRWYSQFYVRGAASQSDLSPGAQSDLRTCGDYGLPGILKKPCDRVDAWVTLNLRGGLLFAEHLWLDLALLNLTDWRYKTMYSGFDFPGFTAATTLTWIY
jgi:outer membrane receptor protein involved in Fe transport